MEVTETHNYEVSSHGDKRFSAFYALIPYRDKLKSIENCYQNDVKYSLSKSYVGKGKYDPNISLNVYYDEYKKLWLLHYEKNQDVWLDLVNIIKEHTNFTDKFASSDVSQARVVSEIVNEKHNLKTTWSRYPIK
jgi:hypothetical protein